MPSRVLYRFAPAALVLAGLAAACWLAGCGDDDPTVCDPYAVGILEGRLTSGGVPLALEIGANPLERGNPLDRTIWTTSDSTGWYRLELPTGLYEMQVKDPASSGYYIDHGDSVQVAPTVQRFDVRRGRADFRFTFPPVYEGLQVILNLMAPGRGQKSMRTSVTDGVADFTFLTLGPDDYWMELDSSTIGRFYLPGVRSRWDAETLTVGTTDGVRVERDFRPGSATITGTVTGAWQETGGSISVAAEGERFHRLGRASCAEDGRFLLTVLFPQPLRLTVHGSNNVRWVGGSDFDSARIFALGPGEHIAGVTIRDSGMQIRLRGPGDLANYHAQLRLLDETGDERTIYMGPGGIYDLYNLDPGRYDLHVSGDCESQRWAPQWYGGSEVRSGAIPVDLAAGERRPLVFDLVEGGRIEGEILVPTGGYDPVHFFALYDQDGEKICDYGDWDDGRMHFQGLADGTYRAAAGISFDLLWFYPGTWDIDEATPITITDHATVTDIVWPLPDIVPGDF